MKMFFISVVWSIRHLLHSNLRLNLCNLCIQLKNNFTLVFTHMNLLCFHHLNVTYLRIFDLFTNKHTYLQVSIKSLSLIIHAIFKKFYINVTHTVCICFDFFVTLIALISRYVNDFILTALILQKYSIV